MHQDAFISTLTSKSQTVIPKAIRQRLHLAPGDRIRYRLRGEKVEIEKLQNTSDQHDPFASFHEWASPEDDAAYNDL
jgi:antitoxin PrlF